MSQYSDIPVLDPDYNEGYPSPMLIEVPDIRFNVSTWLTNRYMRVGYNEKYPTQEAFKDTDVSRMKIQVAPFPKVLPYLNPDYNEAYPTVGSLIGLNHLKVQQKPFPKLLPASDPNYLEGYPNWGKNFEGFGAFSHMPNLVKAKIPETVKFIEDYTFYESNLEKVKIARDCVFFEHTFPPDCVIEYY